MPIPPHPAPVDVAAPAAPAARLPLATPGGSDPIARGTQGIGVIHLTAGTEQHRARTPILSLVLAYVAMLPLASGAAAAIAIPARRPMLENLATIWAGAVLCVLSGVKRGLSFREPHGSTAAEIGEMFVVFSLGATSLLIPSGRARTLLLLAGYAAQGASDIRAADTGEAPRTFHRLRKAQMTIPLASLASLLGTRPAP